MKIYLELDENTASSLDEAAGIKGWSRETAILHAIQEWIDYQPKLAACRSMLREWKGDPDFPRFEADRPGPETMRPDPFEGVNV